MPIAKTSRAAVVRAACTSVESLEARRMLTAAPFLVKDIFSGASDSNPDEFTQVGSAIYFVASPKDDDREIFKSDGTAGGTIQLTNVDGPGGAAPHALTNVNGTLFFAANDPVDGVELWKSDGTVNGTKLIVDIYPGGGDFGVNSSAPHGLVSYKNDLYFVADDGTGDQVWKSDGTAAGTVPVTSINPNAPTSFDDLTVQGNTLFFFGDDAINGPALWKSDGTTAGTSMVKATGTTPGAGGVSDLTPATNQLFFDAFDPSNGYQVWTSDGTAGGTHPVAIINAGVADVSDGPQFLTAIGNDVYFSADNGTTGRQLYRSDGTSGGTAILKDIHPGFSADPTGLINVNGTLYFAAEEETDGVELWKSDGTSAGTNVVTNINAGPDSSNPAALTDVNGTLFFDAYDGNSTQLWQSNGTANGTHIVGTINPTGDAFATDDFDKTMGTANGLLYFNASDGVNGQEFWAYQVFTPSQSATATTLTSSQSSAGIGAEVTLTAMVSGSGGIPTGTVAFFDGATSLGSVALASDGTASLQTAALAVGDHAITATYSGDTAFAGSESLAVDESILNLAASTVAVSSSENPGFPGDSVVLTATVTATGATPTGDCLFFDGSTLLGTGTLTGGANSCTLAVTSLAVGDHAITVHYQGDTNVAPADSATLTQTISASQPASLVPDLSGAGGSLPASVVGGAKLHNVVPVTITNPTGATVSEVITIQLFAGTDAGSIAGATPIGSVTKHVSIKSQKALLLKIKVPTIPASLPDGTYHVLAQLTDSQNLTRLTALPGTVQVAAPFVSLSAGSTALTPGTIAVQKHGTITLTVTNAGNVDAIGQMSIEIDPSSDDMSIIPGSPLAIFHHAVKIKHGTAVKLKLKVTIPAGLAAGDYFPLATISLNGASATASGTLFTVE